MYSLFSRARTNSTPFKDAPPPSPNDSSVLDDFGRIQSRNSHRAITAASLTPTKKDKKKAKDLAKRAKTLGARGDQLDNELEQQQQALPDGSFLPFSLEQQPIAESEQSRETDYGYLSYERHVVLGLEQLETLVNVVVEELENRGGITTPFIFSTTALDISAPAIKRLIRCFLNFCSARGGDAERAWRDEARFAGPHELGMCLRWGLARIVRVSAGVDVRGLIAWDVYLRFHDNEATNGYPPGQFEMFLDELDPIVQVIVVRVLSLLTRLTANSTSSGHTPPTLSSLFGPLLFGLGPATLAFHHTYVQYLRAVNAAEHILLAFIRWQDTPRLAASNAIYPSGSAAALGVPIRLKEWIKGYPAMLPFLYEQQKNVKPQPRKGAKTVTLTTVRRNVRMYSPDLVKSAATWAHRSKSSNGVINGLANSKEWERITPTTLKLAPRYSETYKKRMNLPPDFHPHTTPGMARGASSGSSNANTSLSTLHAPNPLSTFTVGTFSPTSSTTSAKDYLGLGTREGEDRFKNLTDLKWGEFESMGFSGIGDEKKLEFDLTEGAREARAAKRSTMSWNDFSTTGFSRTDVPLNATLQFSTSLTQSVSSLPSKDAELTKKLKKIEKQLPPFGWDTEPVMGNEEIVEESFVDVFCDLVYGGGWMDLERGESLDRDVNWALVEFKSLPTSSRGTVAGGSDPRTNTTLILFEEFVPFEYRQQLAIKSTTRRRLPLLFSPSKKQWKQAPTLNGRPYVVGHVPRSPSYREMEFEGLLQGGSGTKVISLGGTKSTVGASTRVSAVTTTTTGTTGHGHGHRQGFGSDGMREQPLPVPPLPPQPVSSQGGTPSNAPFASTSTNNKKPLGLNTLPRSIPQTPPKPARSGTGGDELQSFTSESTTTHSHTYASTSMMTPSPATKKSTSSRFKITNVISTMPSPKRLSTAMVPPAEYSEVQFETRLASYSDSERNSGGSGRDGDDKGKNVRKKKRESRDDAWVDILVNSHSRRMAGQDVDLSKSGSGVGKGVRGATAGPDPDMASFEVAQVLAAVRRRRNGSISSSSSFSTGDVRLRHNGDEDVVREHGPSIDMDAHVEGLEIDEIERVPRRLRSSESAESGDLNKGLVYEDEYAADDEDVDVDVDARDFSQDFSHGHERSFLEHESRPAHSTPQLKQVTQNSPSMHTPTPSQRGGRPRELEDQEEGSPLLSARHGLRQQRGMGYFELHPERKQLYSSPNGLDPDEELPQPPPQPPLQQQQTATGTGVSVTSYGSPSPDVPSFDSSIERRRAEMERSGVARADSVTIPSTKSSFENGHASATTTSGATALTATTIAAPTAALASSANASVSNGGSTTTTTTSAAPPMHPIGPRAPASAIASGGNGTKTAQLIEMYRERERRAASSTPSASSTAPMTTTTATTGSAPAVPSKIPVLVATPTPPTPPTTPAPASGPASGPAVPAAVPGSIPPLRVPARSASLPGATNVNVHISSPLPEPPAGVAQPTIPATLTKMDVKADDSIEPPPRVPFEETGRASPARYVHGAPLHNVLEEEEEEY